MRCRTASTSRSPPTLRGDRCSADQVGPQHEHPQCSPAHPETIATTSTSRNTARVRNGATVRASAPSELLDHRPGTTFVKVYTSLSAEAYAAVLESLDALRSPAGVMVRGAWLPREKLTAMLDLIRSRSIVQ